MGIVRKAMGVELADKLRDIVSELKEVEVSEIEHPSWKKFIIDQLEFWISHVEKTKTPSKGERVCVKSRLDVS